MTATTVEVLSVTSFVLILHADATTLFLYNFFTVWSQATHEHSAVWLQN